MLLEWDSEEKVWLRYVPTKSPDAAFAAARNEFNDRIGPARKSQLSEVPKLKGEAT